MIAAVRTQYGPPEVLQIRTLAKPIPNDNELLVKVYATTVNRTDCGILWGEPFILRFFTGLKKPILACTGTDFAGTIEAVGKDINSFKVGDKVWGFNDNGIGSHSQYITIQKNTALLPISKNLSFQEAAALPEGAHYAYNFINKVKLSAGQQVLVNGATGAIGSAAVQFLKYLGLHVTGVCATENIELVRSLGADRTIDYKKQDFTLDQQKYDFVFDAVGKSTFGKCKLLLKEKGVYISSELGPNAQNPFLALISPFLGGKKVKFPVPLNIKRSMIFTQDLVEKGKFKPIIDRTYPFEKLQEAFRYVASGQKVGNVVINWQDNQ